MVQEETKKEIAVLLSSVFEIYHLSTMSFLDRVRFTQATLVSSAIFVSAAFGAKAWNLWKAPGQTWSSA
jgi:hypothetical protein